MRVMPGAWAVLALAGTVGCQRQPTFDERYASAQAEIGSEASGIDAELSTRESEAAAVETLLADAPPPTQPASDAR